MASQAFLERLQQGALVFDGAMGTALYERGLLYTSSFEEASVSNPSLVKQVHESYAMAGAHVIETNTFGANSVRLAHFGFEHRVKEINQASVRLAREVAGSRVFVAAAIGPTGLLWSGLGRAELERGRDAFREQIQVLIEEGVDALVLETFRYPEELKVVLEVCRELAPDLARVAQVSFDAGGSLADGLGPEEVAAFLSQCGAHAIGVNCADGPAGVYEMATRMLGSGLPVVAQPNAGLPRRIEGRFAYMATPDYFMLYARRLFKAGIKGVGGCCGTTSEHIKKIASAARMLGGSLPPEGLVEVSGGMRESERPASFGASGSSGQTPVVTSDKGVLGAKLGKQFVVSVEVNPPAGLSLEKALVGARLLKAGGVDVINVADGARASARMGNLALCMRIQEQLDMPTIMHVTARDRNVLGLVAHLLSAHELGVRNMVMITGDPPKMGDFPDATAVYDMDSIGLLRLASRMNRGLDPGGKPLGAATAFLCATGAEPAASDYARELSRLNDKVSAGAEFIMTQPVYDSDVLDRFLKDVAHLNVPVLVGLLPLASYRNAEFLHNEVPGMSVPETVRERMRRAGTGPQAKTEGINIAREMLEAVKDRVAGAYIMPPFGQYELALRVIDGLAR